MSRITMSKDGRPVMNLKVTASLSSYDLAAIVAGNLMLQIPAKNGYETREEQKIRISNFINQEMEKLSNKQILDIAREWLVVRTEADDECNFTLSDYFSAVYEAEPILKKRFKGFSQVKFVSQQDDVEA
jgi:hypothetical protein